MRHKITSLLGDSKDTLNQILALNRAEEWLVDFHANHEYLMGDVKDIARLLVHIAYTALVKCEYSKADFAQIVMPLLGKTGSGNVICDGCKAEAALLRAWKVLSDAARSGKQLQRRVDEHFDGEIYIPEAWEDCDDSVLNDESLGYWYDLDKYRIREAGE